MKLNKHSLPFTVIKGEKGVIHTLPLLLIVAAVGIISYLLISSTAPFQGGLIGMLNPKPASQAAGPWAFEETWDLGALPGASAPMPWSDPRFDIVLGSNDFDGITDGQNEIGRESIATDGILEIGHGPMCQAPIGNNPTSLNNHNIPSPEGEQHSLNFQKNIRPHLTFICNNHMMTMSKSGYAVTSFMPRQLFDWNGRTGTIEFDVNNVHLPGGRLWWDIYIVPKDEALLEMVLEEEGGTGEQQPKRGVKFSYLELRPRVAVIDNYESNQFFKHWQQFSNAFPNDPAITDPRIRRKFRFQLSQTSWKFQIQVDANAPASPPSGSYENVDGIRFWTHSGNFPQPLSFSQGLIRVEHHSYNPTKDWVAGIPWSQYTFHWDNFRFDGPVIPAHTAFEPPPHFINMRQAPNPNTVSQPVKINVTVPQASIKNPRLVGHLASNMNATKDDWRGDPTNSQHWRQYRINGGPWQDITLVKNVGIEGLDRTWSTFRNSLSGVVSGENTIEFRYPLRPSGAGGSDGFNIKDLEIQIDPVGVVSTPTPTPCTTNCPTTPPTQPPTPTPTASPTPPPAETVPPPPTGGITVSFNDRSLGDLLGDYPQAEINWGTLGLLEIANPWKGFLTQNMGFTTNSTSNLSTTFNILKQRRLVSIEALNGGTVASTVSLSCSGNTTKTQSVAVNQRVTIPTGWNNNCTGPVTISSSNGWNTNFDNLILSAVTTATPTPGPTCPPMPQPTCFPGQTTGPAPVPGFPGCTTLICIGPTPTPSTSLPGDITGPNGVPDGRVWTEDYNVIITNFGRTGAPGAIQGDISGPQGVPDGRVWTEDFNVIIGNFGRQL